MIMKIKNNIFTILLAIIIITLLILYIYTEFMSKYNEEGLTNFSDCRAQGYSKEFCIATPVATYGPGTCMCDNGSIGRVLPGFRGGCICNTGFDGLFTQD